MTTPTVSVQRLLRFEGDGALKAYADIEIEGAVLIRGVRVIHDKKGLFISLPSHQGKDSKWYETVVLTSEALKAEVARVVLAAYESEAEA